jgi:hypothetical protein
MGQWSRQYPRACPRAAGSRARKTPERSAAVRSPSDLHGSPHGLTGTTLYDGRWRVLLGLAFFAIGFWLKARSEENLLEREFGEEYRAYRAQTPMLIPSLRLATSAAPRSESVRSPSEVAAGSPRPRRSAAGRCNLALREPRLPWRPPWLRYVRPRTRTCDRPRSRSRGAG